MKKRFGNPKERRGVGLIITTGVLSLLVMIATSFAINMQLEYKAALNQLNYIKAAAFAEAGMEKVIADIRYKVKTFAYDAVVAAYADGYTTGEVDLGDGSYEVTIKREDAKVNINALDVTDYPWIKKLIDNGLSYNEIAKIIDYRDMDTSVTTEMLNSAGSAVQVATGDETDAKNAPYATIEELRLVLNDNNKYDAIKDVITVSAPIIRGGLIGRYYKPVSGGFSFSIDNYLGKIVELGELKFISMQGAESDEESADAEFAGGYLMPDNDWLLDEFGVVYDGYIYILPSEVGSMSFSLTADDAARLYIDGQTVSGSHNFACAGWHPIRIEYYDSSGKNEIELKWGSGTYVPAERLGYFVPSYLGSPTASVTDYAHAGFYNITSTGRMRTNTAALLAQKKVSAAARIFGAWTQTTRAEFSSAWAGEYNDRSDGEILNVNWMDSCPKNASDDLEAAGYFDDPKNFAPNSLKLGYWDNFDEDVAYSFVNLSALSGNGEYLLREEVVGDEDRKLRIDVYNNRAEVPLNSNFYNIDFTNNKNVYVRAWEKDSQSAYERKAYPWCVGYLYPMWRGEGDCYIFLAKDEWFCYKQDLPTDGQDSYPDSIELTLDKGSPPGQLAWQGRNWNVPYQQQKVLSVTSSGVDFLGYVLPNSAAATRTTSEVATIALGNYNFNTDIPPVQIGGFTVYWNNVRMMSGQGTFVSAPFYAGADVDWGVISWNEDKPSNTGISLDGRTVNAATDTNWTASYANPGGQALNLSKAQLFQYKVTMTDSNYNGATPVLEDITITYLPFVEVSYWRTEIE